MSGTPEVILNVDDNEAVRYARTRVLQRAGYSVDEAKGGEEAWTKICAAPPHLVILDVRLPDVSGFTICRRIKDQFPAVLVLQTSASFVSHGDRVRGLDSGADSYLVAPIEPEEMVASVRALMRLRRAEEQLRRVNEDLEERVVLRTGELAEANRRLLLEMEERERAENQLLQAQKIEALGQLTGGIAHDFNNLLTVILGGVEMVRETALDARNQRLLANVAQAGHQAARLTAQLLSFARRQHFVRRKLSIARLLRRLEQFLQQTIGPMHPVRLELPAVDWFTLTDRGQIETLILNLVINARDAMPGGGTIALRVENLPAASPRPMSVPGDLVVLSVSDTGVGMSEEVQAKAFDPFFTTKEVGRGTGLGLSMVHGVARQSGGDVKLESRVGRGTTVRVYLPRVDATEAEVRLDIDGSDPVSGAPGPAPMRLLLVEDNASVRDYTASVLTHDGHTVLPYADGPAALAAVDAGTPYDLAVVDYAMPLMTGQELALELRRRQPGRPVVVMTGYAESGTLDQLARDHVVLRKPYSLLEIRAALTAALSRR
jgi:signal transduction histidine kinase